MENNSEFRYEKIALKDLKLWDENARFPDKYFNKTDSELIEYFLSKKEFKIKELAESIVKDFDLPQSEKVIAYDSGDKIIVLEGNRRLTAYKLLADPNAVSDENTRSFFAEIKKKISINDSFLIECLVTQNIEQGFRYIDRKHANGNNEVGWGEAERIHYNKRRGSIKKDEVFKLALIKIIKDIDLPESVKDQVLGHGFVTTFFRILNSSSAWKEFNFKIDENGNLTTSNENFKEILKVIILNVLEQKDFNGKKINSRSLNKSEEIKNYLESIKNDDFKKAEEKLKKSVQKNMFGEETISPLKTNLKGSNPKSGSRNYLIPSRCVLVINKTKINNIYRELKDDLLLNDSIRSVPNAVSVLFRVFLEVSIDFFLEKTGIPVKNDTKLAGKITVAANKMEELKIATKKQLENIRKVAIAKTSILSIDNFHEYVHSFENEATSSDLKAKWDNLQEFFEILWGYIDKKYSSK